MQKLTWLLVFFLFFSHSAAAETLDVQLLRSVSAPSAIRQAAASADGQRFYLLLENGTVQLYDQQGQLQGAFDAGPDVVGIVPQGADRLLLQMNDQRQVLIVALMPRVQIAIAGAPVKGDPAAPVTIAVFDDFECPYCSRAVDTLKEVLKKYPEQVKLVFKNFPLPMHRYSRTAALAGLAAQKQGKFWPLHDLMFANYQQLNPARIMELAKSLDLDMARFEKDLKDPVLVQRIDSDIQEGKQIGVHGTPTLFINGRRVQQRSVEALSAMIDEELTRLGKTPGQ